MASQSRCKASDMQLKFSSAHVQSCIQCGVGIFEQHSEGHATEELHH